MIKFAKCCFYYKNFCIASEKKTMYLSIYDHGNYFCSCLFPYSPIAHAYVVDIYVYVMEHIFTASLGLSAFLSMELKYTSSNFAWTKLGKQIGQNIG